MCPFLCESHLILYVIYQYFSYLLQCLPVCLLVYQPGSACLFVCLIDLIYVGPDVFPRRFLYYGKETKANGMIKIQRWVYRRRMIIDQTPRLIDLGSKIFLSDTPIAADEWPLTLGALYIFTYPSI